MKIAVITYHRAYNFGSALQAYALNTYLTGQGHEVETIDYWTQRQKNIYTIFEPVRGIMSVARNVQSLLYLHDLFQHKNRFNCFVSQQIRMTDTFSDKEQLTSLNDHYDAYVCGSDQIWNPNCIDFDESYLLFFVADKTKCISYAPSIASAQLPEEWAEPFRLYLKDFAAISVRESAGEKILENLLNRKVSVVLDPVFFLPKEHWDKVACPSLIKKPYILCYFIGDVTGMRTFAKKMSKALHLPLVVVYKNIRDMLYINHKAYSAGPEEFVGLIRDAEYICTNSFHAVAFSVIYQKKFWAFVDTHNPKSAKSRIENIVELMGLKSRILTFDKMDNIVMDEDISYAECQGQLHQAIENSQRFLLDNLEKIGEYDETL